METVNGKVHEEEQRGLTETKNSDIISTAEKQANGDSKSNGTNGNVRSRYLAAAAAATTSEGSSVSSRSSSYKAYMQQHPEAKLIGINGKWYEIRNFIPKHPGGEVIEHFVGKDATPLFKSFHTKNVLQHWRAVGTYSLHEEEAADPAARAFADLHAFFLQAGFFSTSLLWYAAKFAFTLSLLALTVWLIVGCESAACHCAAGVALAAFWQQCGFFLHDFMHSQCTHNRRIDRQLGLLFGTVGVGVNHHWWQEEHFLHHALTNTVDYDRGYYDPQMREELWAQNEKLFPFYHTKMEHAFIRIQHFTFIPMCTVLGRFAIVYYGYRCERRLGVWLAFMLHWVWVVALLYQLPSWQQALLTYFIANVLEGILHIQLIISHYCKKFFETKHICEEQNWYRMQVECNINIRNPVWLDWFHGGLNFHIEHHLFPLMPRHRFREASRYVRAVCKQVGLEYDECGWWQALARTIVHLKHTAHHFSLDPR